MSNLLIHSIYAISIQFSSPLFKSYLDGLDVTLIWMERIDVGTYVVGEMWSYTALPGDINGDGAVDFKDIAILTNNWLETKPTD